jgi:hypothetical protein
MTTVQSLLMEQPVQPVVRQSEQPSVPLREPFSGKPEMVLLLELHWVELLVQSRGLPLPMILKCERIEIVCSRRDTYCEVASVIWLVVQAARTRLHARTRRRLTMLDRQIERELNGRLR